MSKLNNLIGFWNSKSAEHQEDRKGLSLSPKPTSRPKSEIIDRNFVKRMENVPTLFYWHFWTPKVCKNAWKNVKPMKHVNMEHSDQIKTFAFCSKHA